MAVDREARDVALLTLELVLKLREQDAAILDKEEYIRIGQEVDELVHNEINPRIRDWPDVAKVVS